MKKLFPAIVAILCATGCFSGSKHADTLFAPDLKVIPVEYDSDVIYLDLATGKKAENTKKYKDASYFYNGVALVKTEDGIQLIDNDFKPIHKGTFSQATIFNDGIAYVVEPAGHIVAMDKSGKVVFTLDNAEHAAAFHDGVSVFVDEDEHFGLVNTSGKVLIEPGDYVNMVPFGNAGLIYAAKESKSGQKWGVIDYSNKEIIPFEYEDIADNDLEQLICSLTDKLFYMKNSKGRTVVLNTKNDEVLSDDYQTVLPQPDGNFFVEVSGKKGSRYGWVDKKGKELIDAEFSYARPFIHSKYTLAADPTEDDKYGIIDKKGEWVFDPKFENAGRFEDNKLAIVRNTSDQYGVINEKGEFVIKAKYDNMSYLGNGLYLVNKDDSEGILDSKGESVVAVSEKYDFYPSELDDDIIIVQSEYVNVGSVVDKMMEEYNMLCTDAPTKSFYEQKYGVELEGYGWKSMRNDESKYFNVYHSAYADYDYEYSFYGNYDTVRYLTGLKLDFDLKGKAYSVQSLIFNELASRLGASCKMDKDGEITGDTTFTPKGISNCTATIDDEFDIVITPDSGRIQ